MNEYFGNFSIKSSWVTNILSYPVENSVVVVISTKSNMYLSALSGVEYAELRRAIDLNHSEGVSAGDAVRNVLYSGTTQKLA